MNATIFLIVMFLVCVGIAVYIERNKRTKDAEDKATLPFVLPPFPDLPPPFHDESLSPVAPGGTITEIPPVAPLPSTAAAVIVGQIELEITPKTPE